MESAGILYMGSYITIKSILPKEILYCATIRNGFFSGEGQKSDQGRGGRRRINYCLKTFSIFSCYKS